MNKTFLKNNRIAIIYIISAAVLGVMIIFGVVFCQKYDLFSLRPTYIRDVSVDVTGMVLCGVLIFSLAHDKPWDSHNRSLFRLVFSLCALFFLDEICSFSEGNADAATVSLVANSIINFFEIMLIYCFWIYVKEELEIDKKKISALNWLCRSAFAIEAALILLNLKFGFLFSIDATGEYIEGTYERLLEFPTFIIYLVIWLAILSEKERSLRDRAILLSFQIFPVIAHAIGVTTNKYSLVFPAYLFSVMLIYINVFAKRSKKVLEQKVLLDKQRATLMISQIQPHFLYNVLTTISNLCVTDPEEAEETTVLFSQYLRTNLDSLRQEAPVPFRAELGHINTYLELEKKRFKDKLNYEIDCQADSFLVPSLGLQPIVENSVKHGIRGKDTPGHLKISSKKVDGGYEVVIEDDGVGFDMNAPLPDDGRSHVGMINVKNRLEQICKAQVTTISSPGNGCKTTIFFPEENAAG